MEKEAYDLRAKVWGFGLKIQGIYYIRVKMWGLGLKTQGLCLRVEDSRLSI